MYATSSGGLRSGLEPPYSTAEACKRSANPGNDRQAPKVRNGGERADHRPVVVDVARAVEPARRVNHARVHREVLGRRDVHGREPLGRGQSAAHGVDHQVGGNLLLHAGPRDAHPAHERAAQEALHLVLGEDAHVVAARDVAPEEVLDRRAGAAPGEDPDRALGNHLPSKATRTLWVRSSSGNPASSSHPGRSGTSFDKVTRPAASKTWTCSACGVWGREAGSVG